MKKLIALTVLLALVMTAFAGCGDGDGDGSGKSGKAGSSTPEEALESYINVYWGYDEPSKAEAKALIPTEIWSIEDAPTPDEYHDIVLQNREDTVPKITDASGKNYTCSIIINSQEDTDQEQLEEMREEYDDNGLKGQKLTEYCYVSLRVAFGNSSGSDGFGVDGYAYVYQYNGKWYVEYCYLPLGF